MLEVNKYYSVIFSILLIVCLTTEWADVVVVNEKLLQLEAMIKTFQFRDGVVVKRCPAQVYQLIHITDPGNSLIVQVQGGDLVIFRPKSKRN